MSSIRREDYEFHKGKSEYEDILQCNNLPSTATPRGHQTPAAFLIMASGLHKVRRWNWFPIRQKNRMGQKCRNESLLFCFYFQHSMAWILANLCRIPTLTSQGPVVLSLVYQQEPPSSPWQPTTSCPTVSNQSRLKRLRSLNCFLFNPPNTDLLPANTHKKNLHFSRVTFLNNFWL